MTVQRALGGRARPRPAYEGPRYIVTPSLSKTGQWVIVDQREGLCWRPRPTAAIRRFDTVEAAAAKAAGLNTARLVCVVCRHKALGCDCVGRVCAECYDKARP